VRGADRSDGNAEGRTPLIVVRTGAIVRFTVLKSAFEPEGVGVVWDRRVGDRRGRDRSSRAATERRRRERRGPAPPSWALLDFLVVPGVSRTF
jgi:hypothetical protein